jgi:TRAP-type C4-dicarboxylate transport system permease small subunit
MMSPLQRTSAALGRINGPLSRAARSLAGVLLAAMLGLALAQIVSRGLFDHSLDWAEELARVALVWSVLLTGPYAYRKGAHVAIVSFAEALPPRMLVVASLLLNLLVVWILSALLLESVAFWRRGLEISASTLDLKMAWIYWIVPASFTMLILVGLELIARLLLHLGGGPSGIVMEGAMPAVVED